MKVKREELLKILAAVKPGLAKKELVEQATHFIFAGKNIITYNDRICISHPFETDFSCSVKADDFYKLLLKMEADEVELVYDKDVLLIKSGKVKSGMAASKDTKVLDLVDLLELDKQKWLTIPEGFTEGIYLCMFSISKDVSQGFLSCLGVQGDMIMSSDDVRISSYKMKSKIKKNFLIPLTSVIELIKFKPIKYSVSDAWVYFKTEDDVCFSSRNVEGEFPDLQEYFKTEGLELKLPKELRSAIDLTMIMAEGEVDLSKKISVSIGPDGITCRGEKETGWVEKEVEFKYKGKKITFFINPQFFGQVLSKSTVMTLGEGKALFESDQFKHIMSLPV